MPEHSRPITVALVEDHHATRRALLATLGDFPERVCVVGAFADGTAALAHLESGGLPFEVALVDLDLPDMPGAQLIQRLKTAAPSARCVALTVFAGERAVLTAVGAGAYGYQLKDEPIEQILSAVEAAAAGQYPISSQVAGVLARQVSAAERELLSEREEELARHLARGLSYAECAEAMQIKVGTVQSHVKSLYRKLGVNSRRAIRSWTERHLR